MIIDTSSERLTATLIPDFLIRRFAIGENLDAEEFGVDGSGRYLVSEDIATTLEMGFQRSSTLNPEFRDQRVQNEIKNRNEISVNPGVEYQLFERLQLTGSYAFSDVSFVDAEDTGLIDFSYHQISGGANFLWNEVTSLTTSAYLSRFSAPGVGNQSLTLGLQMGAARQFSEAAEASFSVGYAISQIDFQEQELIGFDLSQFPFLIPVFAINEESTTAGGPIATVSVRKLFDEVVATLNYQRQISPTARGSQSSDENISLELRFPVTEQLTARMLGGYFARAAESEDNTSGSSTDLDRSSVVLIGSLSWRLTEQLTLRPEYRFDRSTQNFANLTSYQHSILVTLQYTGDRRFIESL